MRGAAVVRGVAAWCLCVRVCLGVCMSVCVRACVSGPGAFGGVANTVRLFTIVNGHCDVSGKVYSDT